AVLAVVGDIKPKEAIALVENTFGKIPARPPSPPVLTVEPPHAGERRVEVEFSAEPQLLIGYHKPAAGHPDDVFFDVVDSMLTDGRTSRLYKRLVQEKQLAACIEASYYYACA